MPQMRKRCNEVDMTQIKIIEEFSLNTAVVSDLVTRAELSGLLGVSESTLQKLEDGNVSSPSADSYRQYLKYTELVTYLDETFPGRRFAATATLRSEIPSFEGLTAIEYGTKYPGSIDYVFATIRRMFG
jgi:transcriptional regulator with XRE-family HTH domain